MPCRTGVTRILRSVATEPVDHSRRRAGLWLLAVALVAALVIGAILWATNSDSTRKPDAAPPPPSTTPVSVLPPATPTPTTTTPKPRPKPKVPHDIVRAAAPTSFSFAGKGYTIKATVCGMEYVRPLDPPGEQHHTVCWVQHDFGHAPGTNGKGTTYMLGHAWGQDPEEVLNDISESAMRQVLKEKARGKTRDLPAVPESGMTTVPTYPVTALNHDVITLRTGNGTLRYKVRDAYAVSKEVAGYIRPLMTQSTPNRIVIITCGELHHYDYDYNIIVEAYLSSSKAAPKSKA